MRARAVKAKVRAKITGRGTYFERYQSLVADGVPPLKALYSMLREDGADEVEIRYLAATFALRATRKSAEPRAAETQNRRGRKSAGRKRVCIVQSNEPECFADCCSFSRIMIGVLEDARRLMREAGR